MIRVCLQCPPQHIGDVHVVDIDIATQQFKYQRDGNVGRKTLRGGSQLTACFDVRFRACQFHQLADKRCGH